LIRIDRIVGIGAITGGIPLAVFSRQLDLGNFRMPGPGAWPFLLAIVMALLGGWLVFRPQPTTEVALKGVPRWGRLAIALGTLFGYVLILEPLGYLVATTLLMFAQLHWVENRHWATSLFIAVMVAVISFLVFGFWLKVLLPSGILPFRAGV
jgi:putative tricarboxylic transport membrane protein